MSSYQQHPQQRGPTHGGHHPGAPSPKHVYNGPPRVLELLEALKHEIEVLHEESGFSKAQRRELEINLQLTEMAGFTQAFNDLDRAHKSIKLGYEEEIRRLRHELETRNISLPPAQQLPYRKQSSQPEGAPPTLVNSGRNSMGAFGNFMGQPGQNGGPPKGQYQDKDRKQIDVRPQGHRGSIPGISLNPVQAKRHGEELHRESRDSRESNQYPRQQYQPQPPQQYQPNQRPPYLEQKQQDELTLVINPKLRSANLSVDLVHCFDHNSVVCSVKFSPDGKYLATGCNHFSQIFEISSGRKILALVDESNTAKQEDLYIRSVCFSPDGVFLATGAEDRVIRVWDIAHGRVKLRLTGHEQDIYSLDWTKDGKHIVSASGDRTVKIWDAIQGKLERTLEMDSDPIDKVQKDSGVTSVALCPVDGKGIITGSLDEVIRVWDLRSGYLLERFEGHDKSVYSVAFAPDGLSLVSGSLDQTLKIWDLSPQTLKTLREPVGPKPEVVVTKKYRHSFSGHQDYVLTVAYPGMASSIGRVDAQGRPIHDPSFDIDWVVSGGKDRHVIFWNGKDGSRVSDESFSPLLSMSGHKNSVIGIALGPNHGLFATASGDQKARIWRVSRSASSQNQPQWERRQSSSNLNPVPATANDSPMLGRQQQSNPAPKPSPLINNQSPRPIASPTMQRAPNATSNSPNKSPGLPVTSPALSQTKPKSPQEGSTLAPVLALPVIKSESPKNEEKSEDMETN